MRQTTFSRAHRRALPEQASRSRVALAEAASAICDSVGCLPELDLQNSDPACTLPSISSVPTTSFWPVHPPLPLRDRRRHINHHTSVAGHDYTPYGPICYEIEDITHRNGGDRAATST